MNLPRLLKIGSQEILRIKDFQDIDCRSNDEEGEYLKELKAIEELEKELKRK